VRLSPLGTSATVWPIVPAPANTWWWLWSIRWNANWQRKQKCSEKTCPSATLSTTNPTWPDLGSNPGRPGGKPPTKRLSYDTAILNCNFFLNSHSGGWSPDGSTRHVGHWMAYCICPGWLWWWRIRWNEDWQGKPKNSEKACPSTTLSTTNPTWPDPGANPGSQRLTAWAMARPILSCKDALHCY
jgi:hypothetical protein